MEELPEGNDRTVASALEIDEDCIRSDGTDGKSANGDIAGWSAVEADWTTRGESEGEADGRVSTAGTAAIG